MPRLFNDPAVWDRAFTRAAREAYRRHKLMGVPIAIWRDGRVVEIPPEEIVVDDPVDDLYTDPSTPTPPAS